MSKIEQLRQLNSQIQNGNRNSKIWKDLFGSIRESKVNKVPYNQIKVICPQCPRSPYCHNESMLKGHIEKFHFDQLCHWPITQDGKAKLAKLKEEAKIEEEEAKKKQNEMILREESAQGHDDIRNYYLNLNERLEDSSDCSYSDSESTDDELEEPEVIYEDESDYSSSEYDDEESDEDETLMNPKKRRTTLVDKLQNDDYFKKFMQIFEVADKLSEQRKTKLGLLVLDLLEMNDKRDAELKSEEKMNEYKDVVGSDWKRKGFKLRQVEEYYIAPIILPLIDQNGTVVGRYARIPLIPVVKKYLSNIHIRNKLKCEKNYVAQPGRYASPLDAEIGNRIRCYFKIKFFFDDAQIAPANGLGAGKKQKHAYVYMTFPDLPYNHCCHQRDIEIALMVRRSELDRIDKKHRMRIIFKEIGKELRQMMNEGIEIDGETYYVTFTTMNADNLGAYEFGGFSTNFKNDCFICRFCAARGKCKHLITPEMVLSSSEPPPDQSIENQIATLPCVELPTVKHKKAKRNYPASDKVNLNQQQEQQCLECKTIQNTNRVFKLLEGKDYADRKEAKQNGQFRRFPLKLPGIDVSNSIGPDPMHDMPEGVLPIIFELLLGLIKDFLLGNHRKTFDEITSIFVDKLANFPLYEGKPQLRWIESSFKLDGKAIQKLEVFLKFEAIFNFIQVDNIIYTLEEMLSDEGFELYLATKKFTLLVFSDVLFETDLLQMDKLSFTIIDKCQSITRYDVFCKLHHLRHYSQLVRRFGPLNRYANFPFEAKHQFSKEKARRMHNFRNTLKSIMEEHQLQRANYELSIDFKNKNFYSESPMRRFTYSQVPNDIELTTSEAKPESKPFSVNKNIIISIASSRNEWFHPQEFRTNTDGKLICIGDVFALKQTDETGRLQARDQSGKNAEMYKKHTNCFIPFESLSFSKDFFYISNDKYYFLKWID